MEHPCSSCSKTRTQHLQKREQKSTICRKSQTLNHASPPPNRETTFAAMTSFFMLPPPTRHTTINDRSPPTHNTNLPRTYNATNSHLVRELQIALRQARTQMSQTSSSRKWAEPSSSGGGGWVAKTVFQRENARGRRKRKLIRDF